MSRFASADWLIPFSAAETARAIAFRVLAQ